MVHTGAESPLVAFHRGRGRDHKRRSLDEILAWDDDGLEGVHDWVQWVFPLREPSLHQSGAPILSDADVTTFRSDSALRARLAFTFQRVLRFYGLAGRIVEGRPRIEPDPSRWEDRKAEWLFPEDHNHLRITRILSSLAILGLGDYARAFHEALERLCATEEGRRNVTPRTRAFWSGALLAE